MATKVETILQAIVDRLVASLGVDAKSICFMSDNPEGPEPAPRGIYYVVSPGMVNFDEGAWDGGGNNMLTSKMVVIVTIHNNSQNDSAGRRENWFIHSTRGLYPLAIKVLKSLSTHTLSVHGVGLLNQPIRPDQMTGSPRSREDGSLQIGFEVVFDMDLT